MKFTGQLWPTGFLSLMRNRTLIALLFEMILRGCSLKISFPSFLQNWRDFCLQYGKQDSNTHGAYMLRGGDN